MNILHTFAQSSYYYNDSYSYSTSRADNEAAAIVGLAFLGFSLLFTVAVYVVYAFALMKIFKKAGVEGWAAWVPFYNNWKMLEIGGQQGFWAVLTIIPLVNIASAVFMYIAMYNIGLKLDKGGAFVVLAIFLPLVWVLWLALDKSTWNETAGAPSLVPTTPSTPNTPAAPVA